MKQWKPVVGFEGFYEVSDSGSVRSLERQARCNSISTGVRTMGGKLRKATSDKSGYQFVSLTARGKRVIRPVHALVLEAFVGPRPEGMLVRHHDSNPRNNNLGNLSWATQKENMADRLARGLYFAGERHHKAKITAETALAIYNSDEQGLVLAKRYGVCPSKISDIRHGHIWKCVTGGVPRPTTRKRRSNAKRVLELPVDCRGSD